MQLIFAVAKDLVDFVVDFTEHFFHPANKITTVSALPPPKTYTQITAGLSTTNDDDLRTHKEVSERKKIQKNTVMYTSSIATPLRSAAGAYGDTVYTVLPYGSMVMVLQDQDLWAEVASGSYRGWVYVDDLEDRAAHVYPSFVIGAPNDADDPTTIRVRAIINDEFGAGEAGMPLQSEEYVLYRLIRRGVTVKWPPVRPRKPGMWSDILATVPTVRKIATPAVGTVIEFTDRVDVPEEMGHLGYVEAVFPDGTLSISEANWPEAGMYNERILTKAEWDLEHVIFLQFTS